MSRAGLPLNAHAGDGLLGHWSVAIRQHQTRGVGHEAVPRVRPEPLREHHRMDIEDVIEVTASPAGATQLSEGGLELRYLDISSSTVLSR